MSEARITYRGAVYPWHCDHIGHMNVMHYVGKFDEATWNLFASAGVTAEYLRSRQRGMAAVQQNISYKKELLAGDVITVTTRFLEIGDRKFRFVHTMTNGATGEVAAVAELTGVHLDSHARKSVAFDPEIKARLQAMVDADKDLGDG